MLVYQRVLGRTWFCFSWVEIQCSSPCGSFGAPEEALQMLKDMQGARLTEPWMVVVGYISIHFWDPLFWLHLQVAVRENGEILEFPKVIILLLVILVGAPTKTWWVSTICVYIHIYIYNIQIEIFGTFFFMSCGKPHPFHQSLGGC